METIRIEDADDPRIAEFQAVRDRDLTGRGGRFIAEGTVVLRMLAQAHRAKSGFVAEKLLLLENRVSGLEDILGRFPDDVPVYVASSAVLDRIVGFHLHRGVLAIGRRAEEPSIADLLQNLPEKALVVAAFGISNHDNIGSIFRNAAAFGADAVITTARHSPRETGVMAKSASGALDLVPMIEVRNLGDALEKLKGRGMLVLGFDSESELQLKPRTDNKPMAIVMGAEGKGLRQRTRELCDEVVKLDMPGPIKSLNVSNAAAIALFAATAGRS